jgi:peptide-methionine (S)-S-oxide reductase
MAGQEQDAMTRDDLFRSFTIVAIAAAGTALLTCAVPGNAAEAVKAAPAPLVDARESGAQATAYFAGGCFWGVEGVFSHVKGVLAAESGYAGGPANMRVDYEQVSSGSTGYAEVVRIVYDPRKVSYGTLLRVFFSVITDPTTLNYQGPDHGTQYRSALFPQNGEQAKVARAYLAQLDKSGLWSDPVVTKIEPVNRFQPAEAYHQDFLERNPNQGYIRAWDMPKLNAFKSMYPALYSPEPSR